MKGSKNFDALTTLIFLIQMILCWKSSRYLLHIPGSRCAFHPKRSAAAPDKRPACLIGCKNSPASRQMLKAMTERLAPWLQPLMDAWSGISVGIW